MYGLYVCPDVDISMYTLAGVANASKGWGIAGDSYHALAQLEKLGHETWFKLGDRDMATCLARTALMASGDSLTGVTSRFCASLGVVHRILPATDDPVETQVLTSKGNMHLQEFWVKNGGRLRVLRVTYQGASKARPTEQVRNAIDSAERIVLCPANPVSSIGPILAISGMRRLIRRSKAKKVALSPMVGRGPVSGPAGKFLRAIGVEPDARGVARLYQDFLSEIIIDRKDGHKEEEIRRMGIACRPSDIVIRGPADGLRLARELLRA